MSELLNQARLDLRSFIADGSGFGVDLIISTPDGITTAEVRGLASSHNLNVDPETGLFVNTKNIHFSVSESELSDLGYPVRVNNEVAIKDHLITFDDSAGITRTFKIDETMPDETLGLIVCILGVYNG